MNRIRLIAGWAMLTFLYFGQFTFKSLFSDGDSPNIIPLSIYAMALVAWYLLSWINVVNEWNRRPVMFFGRYVRTLGPGISLVEPLTHTILHDVSVQDVVTVVVVNAMQTKDNVGISLTGVLTHRINMGRVKESIVEVEDVDESTHQRALSTLTDVGATTELDKFLEHRDQFCIKIQTMLGERVRSWGVDIKAFELKAFKINDEAVEQAIAMKARAEKEGAAELVRAEYQDKIATALNTAAKEYTDDGRWLKGIETLLELCRSANNNTVIIPSSLTDAMAKIGALIPKVS
jgi:regulator of protease activity HflC (stomatin/prohibitin superfamily)